MTDADATWPERGVDRYRATLPDWADFQDALTRRPSPTLWANPLRTSEAELAALLRAARPVTPNARAGLAERQLLADLAAGQRYRRILHRRSGEARWKRGDIPPWI